MSAMNSILDAKGTSAAAPLLRDGETAVPDRPDVGRAALVRAQRALRSLMLAAALIAVAVLVADGYVSYGRTWQEAGAEIGRLARIGEEHGLKVFEANREINGRIADLLGARDAAAILADEKKLHEGLSRIARGIPQISSISAIGPDGRLLVSSQFYPAPRVSIAGRSDFAAIDAAPIPDPYITTVLKGRINGTEIFNVDQPRYDANGKFLGFVSISLSPEYFRGFYRELASDLPHASVALLRQDGATLARYPEAPAGRGADAGRRLLAAMASGPPEGIISAALPGDQGDSLLAYRRLGNLPVFVIAGQPRATIIATWLHYVVAEALVCLGSASLFIAALWFGLRRVKLEETVLENWQAETARRRQAENALRQANKLEALGHLTGGVAHDFNNLLMIVNNNVYILRQKLSGTEHDARLAAIERAVQTGTKLTRQLLSFSRSQSLRPQQIDLRVWLPNVVDMVRHSVRGNIVVTLDVAADVWPVRADTEEMELALLNLAVNARDAMPNGGLLSIRARNSILAGDAQGGLRGDFVEISIADTGPGIAEHLRERVFEPFFTTKGTGKGTGLGLSQVYGFAVQSAGVAQVHEAPGGGAMICLYLPRVAVALVETPRERVAVGRRGTLAPATVLLVEDNEEVALVTRDLIEQFGCKCPIVNSGREALAWLEREPLPDLVLSDVVMPGGVTGFELAYRLRELYPHLPVVLMTGYTNEMERARAEGMEVLQKPIGILELETVLLERLQVEGQASATG